MICFLLLHRPRSNKIREKQESWGWCAFLYHLKILVVLIRIVYCFLVGCRCAVCLGDYQNSEKLLQLPVCGHAFHKECIDQWLVNNATCPICRTSLLQFGKVVPMNSPAQTPAALQICGRRPLTIQVLSGTASSYDTVLGSNRSDGVRLEFFPDDGTSGCSSGTTNVLFTADTNHQSHPSMEEVIEQDDIADGEHGIQIDHWVTVSDSFFHWCS